MSKSLTHSLTIGLIVTVYSLCFVGIRSTLGYTPPLFFAALRTTVGGVSLLALLPLFGHSIVPEPKIWRSIAVLAVLFSAMGGAVMFLAAGMTSVGIASVLGNINPVLTVLLAVVFLHEPLTWPKAGVLMLAIAGIFLIGFPSNHSSSAAGIGGALLALGSSAIVAATNIVVKRSRIRKALLQLVTWQLLLGGGLLFVISYAFESWSAVEYTPMLILVVLLLGVVGTGVVNYAWYTVIQSDEVGKVSMYFFSVPVLGLASGAIFYREPILPGQLMGIAAIVIAMYFLSKLPKMKIRQGAKAQRRTRISSSSIQGDGRLLLATKSIGAGTGRKKS